MMQDKEIQALLQKYASGELTGEEKALLESWYLHQAAREDVTIEEQIIEQNLNQMANKLPLQRSSQEVIRRMWPKVAAAALVLIACGLWFMANRQTAPKPIVAETPAPQQIHPGKDGAILTLADGRQVSLDSMGNGIVADQTGAQVLLKEGKLMYRSLTNEHSSFAYNTMSTPRGRQFQLELPDGTKVWLNAASSIRYPTAFTGNERRVEITGEVYFEVEPLRLRSGLQIPFKVKVNETTEVLVLGTKFNINAYTDEEAIRTTLLEGKVKVHAAANVILQPGEQAIVTNDIKVARVKTEAAIAWKKGEFMFRNEPLANIMRSLARWYDVEIVYKTDVSEKAVWGSITKYSNVSDVLDMITLTGVAHFRTEGNRIFVLP